jgi:hypothetical protein
MQEVVVRGIALIALIVGGFVILGGKKGNVREASNSLIVVIIGGIIVAIGLGALFVPIGTDLASTIFGG